MPLRGRGRGRGRGSVRGRGRGGRRGGRVFRARQFEEGKEERLVRLHEERQETANVSILTCIYYKNFPRQILNF